MLGAHQVKKHQAVNQGAPSENGADESGNPTIVECRINVEAFETSDREFECLFAKSSRARDQRSCPRCNVVASRKLSARGAAPRSQ